MVRSLKFDLRNKHI